MKITPLLACCGLALLSPLAPRAVRAQDAPAPAAAPGGEVTFDVFYNSLSDDGEWYNTPEYGYVFQPDVAYNSDKWRPYTDGYWAQTEDGWTWVSYESFGWATYHYGRWTQLKDTGWVWVPGYEWGPGWVSWRTSDDKVGWAPLPPKVNLAYIDGKDVSNDAPAPRTSVDYKDVEEDYDTGYTPRVDEDYDIGPESYCFVETRRFGDPRLSEVILPPAENIVYVENSVNVTYISYQHEGDRRFIYNRGPDFEFIRGRCERPIQELRIDRHDDLGFIRSGGRNGNINRVQDGVLQVAAPRIAHRSMDFQQVRPNKIKRTIDHPQILRGWQGVKADPARVAQVREKIKQQSLQPTPAGAAGMGRRPRPEGAGVPAQAQGNMPPAPGANPEARDARREGRQPGAVPQPPPAAQNNTAPNDPDREARRAARQAAKNQGGAPAPQAGQPGQPAVTPEEKAARKAARMQGQPNSPEAAGQQPSQPVSPEEKAARKAARQQQQGGAPATPQANDEEKAARRAARLQQQGGGAPATPQANDEEKAARRAARLQQQQGGGAPAQPQANDEEKAARKAARQQQAEQAGQQQQAQEKAARQAERQQNAGQQQERAAREQAAPPQQRSPEERAARQQARQEQQRPQPQAQPAPQPAKGGGGGGNGGDDDKKHKKDQG